MLGLCSRQQDKKSICFFEKVRNFLAGSLDTWIRTTRIAAISMLTVGGDSVQIL